MYNAGEKDAMSPADRLLEAIRKVVQGTADPRDRVVLEEGYRRELVAAPRRVPLCVLARGERLGVDPPLLHWLA